MTYAATTIHDVTLTPTESHVRDFVALLKPRVMSLVVFSGMAGLWIAPGTLHPLLAMVAILCIAIGSGAAGAINMWYDRDIDAKMQRTRLRPIPAGRIDPNEALHFGVILSSASVLLMGVALNWVAAFWLATAIGFYVFVYTMGLKRRTPQNIVIGGAAGAFPPVIGWAAVQGTTTLEPWLLFLLIFMWTPPHFWALALYKSDDYAKAGVPMLPVVRGEKATKLQMLIYTVLLAITSFIPWMIGFNSLFYAGAALLLNARFFWFAFTLFRAQDHRLAPRMFGFSIFYLFAVLLALVVDHWLVIGNH